MSKILMNLTLPIIVEEINNVLATETYYSQYRIFSVPDLRQKLISYTLNHVRTRYREIDRTVQSEQKLRSQPSSLEEHLQIEAVVREGIQQLVRKIEDKSIAPLSSASSSPLEARSAALQTS